MLSKAQILELLNPDQNQDQAVRPIVEGLLDPAVQVQVAGIDLTVKEVFAPYDRGILSFTDEKTILPSYKAWPFGGEQHNFLRLNPGPYRIILNETINLPPDICGLVRPRSTLLRCGVSVEAALWEPGYSGPVEVLMVVHNPAGLTLYKNARVCQLSFFQLSNIPLLERLGYPPVDRPTLPISLHPALIRGDSKAPDKKQSAKR